MATATAVPDAPGRSVKLGGRLAWTALILVSLTQAVSMIDRQVMAILAPRIKEALSLGDAEVGLLYGTVFAVFYALFSLPLGRIADGWIRTRLLAISIFAWSILTGLAGFAQSFGFLAATRLGVGVGEASVLPAGMSLLTDMFPRQRRGMVTAMIGAAIALGLGGAVWLGGTVADAWDGRYAGGGLQADLAAGAGSAAVGDAPASGGSARQKPQLHFADFKSRLCHSHPGSARRAYLRDLPFLQGREEALSRGVQACASTAPARQWAGGGEPG